MNISYWYTLNNRSSISTSSGRPQRKERRSERSRKASLSVSVSVCLSAHQFLPQQHSLLDIAKLHSRLECAIYLSFLLQTVTWLLLRLSHDGIAIMMQGPLEATQRLHKARTRPTPLRGSRHLQLKDKRFVILYPLIEVYFLRNWSPEPKRNMATYYTKAALYLRCCR